MFMFSLVFLNYSNFFTKYLQQLVSEIPTIDEKLDRASQNGKLIIENSKNDEEKQFIAKTLDSLSHELAEAKCLIEERKILVRLNDLAFSFSSFRWCLKNEKYNFRLIDRSSPGKNS